MSDENPTMSQVIRDYLQAKPFVPFKIGLSDGSVHELRHPENAMLTKHFIFVTPDGVKVTHLYLLHVTQVELNPSDQSRSA